MGRGGDFSVGSAGDVGGSGLVGRRQTASRGGGRAVIRSARDMRKGDHSAGAGRGLGRRGVRRGGLANDDDCSGGGAELGGGVALVDGDFEHACRTDDGDDFAGFYVAVGGSEGADA